MKILILSNHPAAYTGYGVEAAQLGRRLKAEGHDVAFFAYYGQQFGMGEWEGMPVYPVSFDPYGNDVVHEHALHWFGGDAKAGWIISIMDVFGISTPLLKDFNLCAWTPIDHFPCPPAVLEFFTRTGATPVAMSRFGEDLLRQSGLDPLYAPLAIETSVFKPTPELHGEPSRKIMGVPDAAFVVMMNGMNKGGYGGYGIHRKGYPHAFLAFARFAKAHPDAIMYVHSEKYGGGGIGINLVDLLVNAGCPAHQVIWANQYTYRAGVVPPEVMAAFYSAADVLLAPSMGEGFCLPLVEAQACGTPVIVTDFSAQPELVGAGWKVEGQPWWEAAQTSWVVSPDVNGIYHALEDAYKVWSEDKAEWEAMAERAVTFAQGYDADNVFDECWRPILTELDDAPVLELDRDQPFEVAVLIPVMNRPENVAPLVESFNATTTGDTARLVFVCDPDDHAQIEAIKAQPLVDLVISDHGSTFAQKINSGFEQTLEPWIFVTGDDVRFRDGWQTEAAKLADRFDVIGTNDHPEGKGNARVASGAHSDHFFVRRAYVDRYGASLGDPGVVCHEGYRHFYTDVEVVELAKARRVFSPCLDSLVEHMHPDLDKADVDATYQLGWGQRKADEKTWRKRAPLVQMQRQGRA